MTSSGDRLSPAEVARAVRLRRLTVWLVSNEHFRTLLEYCVSRPLEYREIEWRGRPAVLTNDSLFMEGR